MKKTLTPDEMKTLRDAHLSVLGTPDYQKYLMENTWKTRRPSGRWTGWYWIGWRIPYSHNAATIKKVGGKVYIMTDNDDGSIERYEVTPEVNELLSIY